MEEMQTGRPGGLSRGEWGAGLGKEVTRSQGHAKEFQFYSGSNREPSKTFEPKSE